jgi:hypothetical protein
VPLLGATRVASTLARQITGTKPESPIVNWPDPRFTPGATAEAGVANASTLASAADPRRRFIVKPS